MCGICGHSDDPGGAAVRRMNGALRHRGPDDAGVHTDASTGQSLGATRLSIIDVEGGHQPLANEDGTVVAVLNGEIYNHPVLQAQLRARGHHLKTTCDTEVLVHLYEDYGDDFVHALDGMYAFALWDAVRKRLLVGRDRFGEKPLFYRQQGRTFAFASELTALLAAGGPAEPSAAALDAYFVLGYVPGPDTAVEGVAQLAPGHLLAWEGEQLEEQSYWNPPAFVGAVPDDGVVDEIEHALTESVRSRMIADVPLGVFLSGGTDSTLVASLATDVSSHPVQTFTVGYDVGGVSEADEARRVAQMLRTDHHELLLKTSEIEPLARDLFGRLDHPVADRALLASYAVSRFAREHVKVVVGGEGADELFGGYPRYRWLALSDRLERRVPEGTRRIAARGVRRLPLQGRVQRLANVLDPVPMAQRHLDWVTEGREQARERFYGPRLQARFGAGALAGTQSGDRHPDAARRLMLDDQALWLPDDVLMKADRASMLASLEVRTPFLQPALADLAATVPTARLLAGGGKSPLREVLDRRLAGAGGRRSKVAFRVPAAEWLRGPLEPVLREQVAGSRLYQDGYLDRAAVGQALDAHVTGRADWTGVLWPAMVLAFWMDRLGGSVSV